MEFWLRQKAAWAQPERSAAPTPCKIRLEISELFPSHYLLTRLRTPAPAPSVLTALVGNCSRGVACRLLSHLEHSEFFENHRIQGTQTPQAKDETSQLQDTVIVWKLEESKLLGHLVVLQIKLLAGCHIPHSSKSWYALIWDNRQQTQKSRHANFSLDSLKILHTSAPFTGESRCFYEF